jgi:hypothetical protein
MWQRLKERLDSEPVMFIGALRNVMLLAAAFGLRITDVQTAVILATAGSVLDLLARSRVSPVAK